MICETVVQQVRQCYLHGTEEGGSAGKVVARLLNTAVSAGKRARAETSISKGKANERAPRLLITTVDLTY